FIVGKSKEIFGIIAEKNTIQNYTTDEKKVKNSKIEELFIDTGYTKKDIEKNIQIGSAVILKSAMKNMLNDKFFGSAMDNRAGIVAILNTLEKLQNKSINYDIYIVFTSQEELGLRGAYTTTFEIMPDYAIAIDVTHGMTPDTKDEIGVFPLGSGAIICRGPNLHYDLTKKIIQIAKENNISHEIEVASGGSGTTAWAIQTVGNGVPVALISIPLRYMHTNVETLSLFDIESVSKLLNKILTGGAFDA
ncbi:MAG: M20/M25/M40 family metallo-hydrolase, partial [Oscillospiraceae bacterium]